MNPLSIGPDMNPLSKGPEPGTRLPDIGPEEFIKFFGIGCSGIEEKDVVLSKAAARSKQLLLYLTYGSTSAVESCVYVLALTEAPDIVRKVVVDSSEWTLDEESRVRSGLT